MQEEGRKIGESGALMLTLKMESRQKIDQVKRVTHFEALVNEARDDYYNLRVSFLHTLWKVILGARSKTELDEKSDSFQQEKSEEAGASFVSPSRSQKGKERLDGSNPRRESSHIICSPLASTTGPTTGAQLHRFTKDGEEKKHDARSSGNISVSCFQLRLDSKNAVLLGKREGAIQRDEERGWCDTWEGEVSESGEGHDHRKSQGTSGIERVRNRRQFYRVWNGGDVDSLRLEEAIKQSVSLLVLEEGLHRGRLRVCFRLLKWSIERQKLWWLEAEEQAAFSCRWTAWKRWRLVAERRRRLKAEVVLHWKKYMTARIAQHSHLLSFLSGLKHRAYASRMVVCQRIFRYWQMWVYRLYIRKHYREQMAAADHFCLQVKQKEHWYPRMPIAGENQQLRNGSPYPSSDEENTEQEEGKRRRNEVKANTSAKRSDSNPGIRYGFRTHVKETQSFSGCATLWRTISRDEYFLMCKQRTGNVFLHATEKTGLSGTTSSWLPEAFLYHPHYHEVILPNAAPFSSLQTLGITKALFLFWKKRVERHLSSRLAEWILRQRQISTSWRKWERKYMHATAKSTFRGSVEEERGKRDEAKKEDQKEVWNAFPILMEIRNTARKRQTLAHRVFLPERSPILSSGLSADFSLRYKLHIMTALHSSFTRHWAFELWRIRVALRQADWHYIHSIQSKVIRRWKSAWRYRLLVHDQQRTCWAWWRWRMQVREDVGVALCWHRQRVLHRCLALWKCESVIQRQHRREGARWCVDKWKVRFLRRQWDHIHRVSQLQNVLRVWHHRTVELQRRRATVVLADCIHRTVVLIFLFQRWRKAKRRIDRLNLKLRILADLHDEKVQKECFYRWKRRCLFPKKDVL